MADLFLVFDVESIGLHGEGFAVGYVVKRGDGQTLEEGILSAPSSTAKGADDDRAWVLANIPPLEPNCDTPHRVRLMFWRSWLKWKAKGALLVSDCAWPVEVRFLAACVDDDPDERKWQGPYPLHDLASVAFATGNDPTATHGRLPDELPAHNPLTDARQSARLWIELRRRLG